MLDLCDFTRNPQAAEFGRFGSCNVRYGKAVRGSVPRRQAVLTVFCWTSQVLAEYTAEVLPQFRMADRSVLWPTERQSRISSTYIDIRFAQYRDELGLDPMLHPHCLRHSYVTHLIEDGYNPLFVQQQVGHTWASTTALYTGVSGDYRNTVLRRSLDHAFQPNDEPDDEGDPCDKDRCLPLAPSRIDGRARTLDTCCVCLRIVVNSHGRFSHGLFASKLSMYVGSAISIRE